MAKTITKEMRDTVEKALNIGISQRDIVDATGLQKWAVEYIAKENGNKRKPTAFDGMKLTDNQLKVHLFHGRKPIDCKKFCTKSNGKCNAKGCLHKLTLEFFLEKTSFGLENRKKENKAYYESCKGYTGKSLNYAKLEQEMIEKFGRNFYTGR